MSEKGQRSKGRRTGNVFTLRLRPDVRLLLEQLCATDRGPRSLGPWLVWRALLQEQQPGPVAARGDVPVVPSRGSAGAGITFPGAAIPGLAPSSGNTPPAEIDLEACDERAALSSERGSTQAVEQLPPIGERLILDLCAGSGSWSEPYKRAGYPVRRVTLPRDDVRTFIAPKRGAVWGVLCAPPCTEFSLAKNGQPRDFVAGLACVNACMRIVLTARPRWWALENPVGLLGRWLGEPRDVFEPHYFGDPWTKRTALWGDFERPKRGPFVTPIDGGGPLCSKCYPDDPHVCGLSDHLAQTPAGFARAFCEANP